MEVRHVFLCSQLDILGGASCLEPEYSLLDRSSQTPTGWKFDLKLQDENCSGRKKWLLLCWQVDQGEARLVHGDVSAASH